MTEEGRFAQPITMTHCSISRVKTVVLAPKQKTSRTEKRAQCQTHVGMSQEINWALRVTGGRKNRLTGGFGKLGHRKEKYKSGFPPNCANRGGFQVDYGSGGEKLNLRRCLLSCSSSPRDHLSGSSRSPGFQRNP